MSEHEHLRKFPAQEESWADESWKWFSEVAKTSRPDYRMVEATRQDLGWVAFDLIKPLIDARNADADARKRLEAQNASINAELQALRAQYDIVMGRVKAVESTANTAVTISNNANNAIQVLDDRVSELAESVGNGGGLDILKPGDTVRIVRAE